MRLARVVKPCAHLPRPRTAVPFLRFPFTATCITKRAISPLRVGDEVEVIGMPGEDECSHEVFVSIRWDRKDGLAVPLSQLKPIDGTDEQTQQAIADWHYWVRMGYEF